MTFNQIRLQKSIEAIDRNLQWASQAFWLPSVFVCTATAEMELGVTAAWLARHRDVNGGKLKEFQLDFEEQVPGCPQLGHAYREPKGDELGSWIDGRTLLESALYWGRYGEDEKVIKRHRFAGEAALGRTRTARQCLPLAWNLEVIRGHLLAESFAKEQQRR